MTPSARFKMARRKLGLSVSDLSVILDTDPNTIRRWEREEGSTARDPNPIACRVLSWLLEGYRPPEWPAAE